MMSKNNKVLKMLTTDAFDTAIPATDILSTIDTFIKAMQHEKDIQKQKKMLSEFNKTLKSWQLITINPNDKRQIWVKEPFVYTETDKANGLTHRIIHLFKTGVWKESHTRMHAIHAHSNTGVPLQLNMDSQTWTKTSKCPTRRTLCKIIELYDILKYGMDNGFIKNLGVFKKPDGVIAMNQSKVWLSDHEQVTSTSSKIKHSMEITSMYDLINDAEIIVNILIRDDNDKTLEFKTLKE